MKNLIIPLIAGMLYSCLNVPANAQQHNEKLKKEFNVANANVTTLYVYNIFGSLKIEGYEGDKVLMEIEKTVTAADDKTLELGKKEFQLGFDQRGDSIIAYIATPYDSRPNSGPNNHEVDYRFSADFVILVPYNINLKVATIDNGAVTVTDVRGILHVNNINDGITIVNAGNKTLAHTVNGDIKVSYLKNPAEPCSYQTISGDIRISYQPDFSADCQFKSMNGEFFTDFPEVETLPSAAVKKQDSKGGKTVYKLDKVNTIRFGKGGKVFKFETLSGDVYIKKQS